MKPGEYVKKALRTESKKYGFSATGKVTPRIEHAVYGLVTEAGELMDQIKKAKIYNKELDTFNLMEEAGDLMWYLALLSDELKVSFEEIWETNVKKLKVRYPEKYSDEKALNRDLKNERAVLEKIK
jgi:NTP pyrophosphatase (non-canonical NTP hydrolase)